MPIRLVLPALVALLFSGEAAAADNPAVQACAGKSKGTACTFMKAFKEAGGPLEEREVAGTCADDKCCELDYSKGSPPTSNCSPCLTCKEGSGAAPAADEGGEAAKTGPNQEPPRTGDDPPATSGNGKRGCMIGDVDTEDGLAALVVLVLALRRRSKRSR